MRYEVQWDPKGKAKYDIDKLFKAVSAQDEIKNAEKVIAVNRYQSNKPPLRPEAVQFTVTGSYPYEALENINKQLTPKTKVREPQNLSIRAISFEERKKTKSSHPKRKKCKCKK
jgi:hypothetical protein